MVGFHSRNVRFTFCVSFSICPIASRLLSCATYLPQYTSGGRGLPVFLP